MPIELRRESTSSRPMISSPAGSTTALAQLGEAADVVERRQLAADFA
jgi:hypothetical protein